MKLSFTEFGKNKINRAWVFYGFGAKQPI